jgi:uncharacterized protein YybS (DUF2232 family)
MPRLQFAGTFLFAITATISLLMIGVAIPPAGLLLIPLVPQPALFLGYRFGITWGIAAIAAAVLVLTVVAGKELAVICALFGFMSLLLFALLGRLRSIELLVCGVAALVFTATTGLLFYLYGSWPALVQDVSESLSHNLATAMQIHEKMGFPQDSVEILKERMPEIIATTLEFLPGLLFVSLSLVVLINIVLLCRRFPERRSEWLAMTNFREWKGPEHLVWGLIACGFALFVPGLENVRVLAVNLLLVIGACYFVQGLSVIAYYFHKNKVPRFLRGVTYVLIAFEQIFTLLVVGVGLFDLWGDFRRLGKNKLNPSQAS